MQFAECIRILRKFYREYYPSSSDIASTLLVETSNFTWTSKEWNNIKPGHRVYFFKPENQGLAPDYIGKTSILALAIDLNGEPGFVSFSQIDIKMSHKFLSYLFGHIFRMNK